MTVRPIALRLGRNVRSLDYKSDPTERANEIYAKCALLAGKKTFLGNARFRVSSANSGAKTFVPVDPTGAVGAIGFDDQLVGWSILREKTGLLYAIDDTVASTQVMTLATWPSGMADGEYVQLRDEDDLVPHKLMHPVYAAATYPGIGPKFGKINREHLVAVANLAENGAMRTWTDATHLPDGWTFASGAAFTGVPLAEPVSDNSSGFFTSSRNTDPLYTRVGGYSLGFEWTWGLLISKPILWTPQYTGQRVSVRASLLLTDWAAHPAALLTMGIGVRRSDDTVQFLMDQDKLVRVQPTTGTRDTKFFPQLAEGVWDDLVIHGIDLTEDVDPSLWATAKGIVVFWYLTGGPIEGVLDGVMITATDEAPPELSEFGDANAVYQDTQVALGRLAPPQYTFSAEVLDLKRLNPSLDEEEMDRGNFVAIDSTDFGIVNDVQRITDARINDGVEGDTTIVVEPRLKRFTRRLIEGAKRTSARVAAIAKSVPGGGTGITPGGSTAPGIGLTGVIDGSNIPTITATVSAGVISVKFAVSLSAYPDLATTQAATPDTTPPFEYVGSALSPGDTLYVSALAYDNNGQESGLAQFSLVVVDPGFRTITIDHTKVGASTHTDFVLPFVGTYSELADTGNGGQLANVNNLVFYADAGLTTPLDFERVEHDLATGAVDYRVRIPSLSHTTDTVIYLAWDSSTTDRSAAASTWSSSHEVVQHYAPSGGDASLEDSTANNRDAGAWLVSGGGATTLATATGKLGGGAATNGTKIAQTAFNGSSLNAFTIAFSVKLNAIAATLGIADWQDVVQAAGSAFPYVLFQNNSGTLRFYVDGGYQETSQSVTTGVWYRLAVTMSFSGGTATWKFYKDGVLLSTYTGGRTNLANALYLSLGRGFNGSQDAIYDELVVASVVRSADWMLADYNSQNDPASFYAVA